MFATRLPGARSAPVVTWPVVCVLAVLTGPALGGSGGALRAEEIAWRYDYARALKEAAETGRPMMLNIGSEDCFWCKQLDGRTFVDERIVRLLNDRFIPFKVDGEKSSYLVKALKIQSYPTLVFAAHDGNIQAYREGFLDADKLREQLVRVLAAVGVPDWMQRDYDDAQKAIAKGDNARALALLQGVLEDGKKRPLQLKARAQLTALERKAAEEVARARSMAEKGNRTAAVDAVNEVSRNYPGTLAARQGKVLVGQLTSREDAKKARQAEAKTLLAQARQELKDRQYLICLDRCEVLTSKYADLPEGEEASRLSEEIKGNTEWAKKASDDLGDRLCVLYLALGDSWLKKGQPQQAIAYYDRVSVLFPSSKHSAVAKAKASRLRGTPAGRDD